jgi:hypothetical protein
MRRTTSIPWLVCSGPILLKTEGADYDIAIIGGRKRPYPYHSCCHAPVIEDAEVKWPGVSVADRGEPVASCSEWHGDGTAGEDDRASRLAAVAPAWAMGEARPG